MAVISITTLDGTLAEFSVIEAMGALWRERGHDVRVGKLSDPEADATVLHLNISVVPPDRIPDVPAGTRLVNGKALDIRKRRYSELGVTRESDWDGPVIVKTDANHFGIPEQRVYGKPPFERQTRRLAAWNWKLARRLPFRTYPVLDHLEEVPNWVWNNPAYIVERFMPERDGAHYCLRGWMFFGSQGYGWRLISTDPMVKTGTMVDYEYLEDIPEELSAMREKCEVDFGKIDYVVHDGRAIVLDVNKTPSFSGDPTSPRFHALARGIEEYLP